MSLLDVVAITGLPINSPDCTPDMQSKRQYNVVLTNSYSDFIAHNMGAEGTKITKNEHVAFLFYWLNAVLFCSRSVQMSKFYLPLATLLHEGKALNLVKLLLGHIFEELGQFVCDLRDNKIISTGGPLWLLQLWLNAIFENFMTKSESSSIDKQYIDGFRLAEFKPNFPDTESDEDRFWAVFSLFLTCKDFDNNQLNFTPFLRRNRGPTWLERLLFPDTNEANELANQSWANMLAVQPDNWDFLKPSQHHNLEMMTLSATSL
ncbi:hypothetical protein Ahy_B08g089202 [Arachis hypogaea]|uniref:Aminotransferase-like plant mobile domain-containing protein n=1 Tax=Arachis hypogaea TaxID=3818 RepID=A0A444XX01_ARAHY|nr:hypothetical protein Ahy_B08g089202 [Arachis hypogaea]